MLIVLKRHHLINTFLPLPMDAVSDNRWAGRCLSIVTNFALLFIVDKRTTSCTIDYMKVLIDSDALIKLTRAGMKELLVTAFSVCIPQAVAVETASDDMCTRYPDAVVIKDNLEKELLHVVNLPQKSFPELILFRGGDRDIAHCALNGGYAAVVTDDAYLLEKLKASGISVTVPAAMIIAVGRKYRLPVSEVLSYLSALQPYISQDEYATYLLIIEGRYPGK